MWIRNWTWAILGIISLIVRLWAHHFPETTESIYSRSIFPVLRTAMDLTIVRLPFPTFYLFLAIILFFLGRYLFWLQKHRGWKEKLLYSTRAILNFVGAIVFFFLVLWGYYYQRIPFIDQLHLDPQPFEIEELFHEVKLTEGILSTAR